MNNFAKGTNTTFFAWPICYGVQWWNNEGRQFSCLLCVGIMDYVLKHNIQEKCIYEDFNLLFIRKNPNITIPCFYKWLEVCSMSFQPFHHFVNDASGSSFLSLRKFVQLSGYFLEMGSISWLPGACGVYQSLHLFQTYNIVLLTCCLDALCFTKFMQHLIKVYATSHFSAASVECLLGQKVVFLYKWTESCFVNSDFQLHYKFNFHTTFTFALQEIMLNIYIRDRCIAMYVLLHQYFVFV